MDHRERILAAISHQPLDRVPTDMWATAEVQEKLFAHFGIDTARDTCPGGISLGGGLLTRDVSAILELWDRLAIDGILMVMPPYIGPPLPVAGDMSFDEWGMGRRRQSYESGEYSEQVIYPLAQAETISDLEAYRWPDPDWYDYAALPALAARCRGRAICCGYTAPFYYHNMLRGLELSLMDPILRPEFTAHLLDRLSAFFTEYHRRCFDALRGMADMTQVTDDFGSQSGLLISPRVFDRFYRAPLQRAIRPGESVRSQDLSPRRWRYARAAAAPGRNGHRYLEPGSVALRRMGPGGPEGAVTARRLCFHSAVDNQQTLPFGRPADVSEEVKRLVQTLANDRTGLILGPCHNLQAITPIENIIAMYEAAQKYGSFTSIQGGGGES